MTHSAAAQIPPARPPSYASQGLTRRERPGKGTGSGRERTEARDTEAGRSLRVRAQRGEPVDTS